MKMDVGKITSHYSLTTMFDQGYAVYAFNIALSDLGEEYINLVRQGSLRLEVKFAINTTETQLLSLRRISDIVRG